MKQNQLGQLWPVSALTIGGGGIGQVWGDTTRDESVAVLTEAIDAGINLIDVAPLYGRGEAENVVGAAYSGKLPDGVHILTKCMLGNPGDEPAVDIMRRSLENSLSIMQLAAVDDVLIAIAGEAARHPHNEARSKSNGSVFDGLRDLTRVCAE